MVGVTSRWLLGDSRRRKSDKQIGGRLGRKSAAPSRKKMAFVLDSIAMKEGLEHESNKALDGGSEKWERGALAYDHDP